MAARLVTVSDMSNENTAAAIESLASASAVVIDGRTFEIVKAGRNGASLRGPRGASYGVDRNIRDGRLWLTWAGGRKVAEVRSMVAL